MFKMYTVTAKCLFVTNDQSYDMTMSVVIPALTIDASISVAKRRFEQMKPDMYTIISAVEGK